MPQSISVENLSKLYHIGALRSAQGGSLRESFTDLLKGGINLIRKNVAARSEELWALKDINFTVERGEIVGLIGSNGAGKSTLLKILSRVTEPTTGRVSLHGRVGSLLEVGTGFHPELTGRENVFLNGAILGMGRREIADKFDEIVAFSEVERFIDTPVKYYSSGMYMRLAFAIAAHLEPDILIVDEVLAVGDVAFQKKCLGKMDEATTEGRTVLFVSHNMVAVQSLCRRVLWLQHGSLVLDGEAPKIARSYLESQQQISNVSEEKWEDIDRAPGTDIVRLRSISVRALEGDGDETLTMETPLAVEIEFWNLLPEARLHVTLHVMTAQGLVAFTSGSARDSPWTDTGFPAGLFRCVCYIPANLLNTGMHRFVILVVKDASSVIYQYESAVSFEIHDLKQREISQYSREPGVLAPVLRWTTEKLDQPVDKNQDSLFAEVHN